MMSHQVCWSRFETRRWNLHGLLTSLVLKSRSIGGGNLYSGVFLLKFSKIMIILLLVTVIIAGCKSTNQQEILADDEMYKRKLRILLFMPAGRSSNHGLYEKIRQFESERFYVEIEFTEMPSGMVYGMTPWLLDKGLTGEQPDLIEIIPNKMRLAHHHNKLAELSMNQPQLQDLVIQSPDGYVYGVKTTINPLIVYYNKEIFQKLGMDPPSEEWDWAMLDNAINALKAVDHNVHILFSPSILEWVTINRFGGRIVDTSGTGFSGYFDSEEAIQAAEWLKWVGTKKDLSMPRDLVEGKIALAIDFAFHLPMSGITEYESVVRNYDQIGIAPLPGGPDVVNVAHTSGLVIPKYSENKDLALELLTYLTQDQEEYYENILRYTNSWRSNNELSNPERNAIIIREMKRSVPSTLLLNESQNVSGNSIHYVWLREKVLSDQPVENILGEMAQELDTLFDTFKQDLELYEQCMQSTRQYCVF